MRLKFPEGTDPAKNRNLELSGIAQELTERQRAALRRALADLHTALGHRGKRDRSFVVNRLLRMTTPERDAFFADVEECVAALPLFGAVGNRINSAYGGR